LTINLGSKDGKKKKVKAARPLVTAEEPATKRKKVCFQIDKNMTRGKSSLSMLTLYRIPPAFKSGDQSTQAISGEGDAEV